MIVFNKKFVIGILFIMGLCILAFISFAQTLNTDDISSDEINSSLNNIMKNEFGSIKIKNEKTSDNRAVLEDNKYIYNVDKASGKIIHFLIKDYTKNSNIVGNISKKK